MKYNETIQKMKSLSHNVVQLQVKKPSSFEYGVGDAVELKVPNQDAGPFTMTNIPQEHMLEFIIRIYSDHQGKTQAISEMHEGDEIRFSDPFNTFKPKEKSIFLAGGTGITPFIAIMRAMHQQGSLDESLLLFSNKSSADVFMKAELKSLLGTRYHNIITQDKSDPDYYGNIDEDYLKKHLSVLNRPVLVCGPPPFNEAMVKALKNIGVADQNIDTGS